MGAIPGVVSVGGLSRRDLKRVMIFIDGANLHFSMRDKCKRTDLDYEVLCRALTGGRDLRRAYYYNAWRDQSHEPDLYRGQQQFFDYLQRVPKFEVKLGNLEYRNFPKTPPRQKGVDVCLATDMLAHAFRDNYDTAVLVSGDADFAYAVQLVKDLGKNVEIALFGAGGSSRRLRDVADEVIPLSEEYFERYSAWARGTAGSG